MAKQTTPEGKTEERTPLLPKRTQHSPAVELLIWFQSMGKTPADGAKISDYKTFDLSPK